MLPLAASSVGPPSRVLDVASDYACGSLRPPDPNLIPPAANPSIRGSGIGSKPEQVVRECTTLTQTRSAVGALANSMLSTVKGHYQKFRFGGQRVIFYIAHTYFRVATLEPYDGTNCGGGCGIAGVGITNRR